MRVCRAGAGSDEPVSLQGLRVLSRGSVSVMVAAVGLPLPDESVLCPAARQSGLSALLTAGSVAGLRMPSCPALRGGHVASGDPSSHPLFPPHFILEKSQTEKLKESCGEPRPWPLPWPRYAPARWHICPPVGPPCGKVQAWGHLSWTLKHASRSPGEMRGPRVR